jgi:hypothetical protein
LVTDLDDVACDAVFEDFQGLVTMSSVMMPWGGGHVTMKTHLLNGYASRQQLDQITSLQNGCRVEGFTSSLHSHATLHQVQRTGDSMLLQSSRHHRPSFLQILFAILGEQGRKRRFFRKTTGDIVIGLEFFDLVK